MFKKIASIFVLAILLTAPAFAETLAGNKNVTTAGTQVTLVATTNSVAWVIIQAKTANTGSIYLGGPDVASTDGIELLSGDTFTFPVERGFQYDLLKIWIDSSVNGEGVVFTYENR